MAERRETYKGREIVVRAEEGKPPALQIDGKDVEVRMAPAGGRVWSPRFAFQNFDTAEELARKLIDQNLV